MRRASEELVMVNFKVYNILCCWCSEALHGGCFSFDSMSTVGGYQRHRNILPKGLKMEAVCLYPRRGHIES